MHETHASFLILIRRAVTGAFLILLASTALAAAQGVQTGTIRGIVTDTQNLPVPGVTVTVTSPALQGQRSTVTGSDGGYVLRLLPAGDYAIAFELSAFATSRARATVPLGGVIEQNVTLQAQGISEEVRV